MRQNGFIIICRGSDVVLSFLVLAARDASFLRVCGCVDKNQRFLLLHRLSARPGLCQRTILPVPRGCMVSVAALSYFECATVPALGHLSYFHGWARQATLLGCRQLESLVGDEAVAFLVVLLNIVAKDHDWRLSLGSSKLVLFAVDNDSRAVELSL